MLPIGSQYTNYSASVDAHFDELIQRLVREQFQNRTVISVVHKLQSALDDFDMVVVLDAGELQEFGTPRELLAKGPQASAFASMYNSLRVEKK
jgi:ABC-type multidrug transport system fused ATPase/permease subunit